MLDFIFCKIAKGRVGNRGDKIYSEKSLFIFSVLYIYLLPLFL